MRRYPPLLLTLLLLVGCSRDRGGDDIEYWCASNIFEVEFARQVVNLWNADTSHRTVRLQPVPEGQSSEEVILAAVVGKTTPDIYSNMWPGAVEQYREAGVILPFNSFPDFSDYVDERLPESLIKQFISSDGRFYQFPWKGNPLLMAYNKELLNDFLECDLPRTYEDFYQIGEKLSQRLADTGVKQIWMLDPNITPLWWQRYFDFYTFYVSASQGRTFISPEKEVFLNSSAGQRVFEFFREGYRKDLMPISLFKEDIFLMGRLIFHITGPWSNSHYERFAPEGFEWGYTPIPVPEEGMLPYTYGDTKNIVIFSDTQYPDDCWEFIKFMTSKQNDYLFMQVTQ
ncbi:MAG: extracellular solute-binding protein [Candidatus Neomarinimicrobiota bacterium]